LNWNCDEIGAGHKHQAIKAYGLGMAREDSTDTLFLDSFFHDREGILSSENNFRYETYIRNRDVQFSLLKL
jgi:hypothetical protein